MKQSLLLLLLFPFTLVLSAQSRRAVLSITSDAQSARWQSPVYEIPLKNAAPFLSYFLKWEGDPSELQIRFSPDGQSWSGWQAMPRDEHSLELPVSILGTTDAGQRFFQVEGHSLSDHPYRLDCHFFSPGKSPVGLQSTTAGKSSGRSCSDLMPAYFSRQEWCPDGSCPENPQPVFAEVTHLVIHHSAGSNQSSDWPAVVRAIWDFHVNGRGWADIGYNWLVDPLGHVYQGRSNDAIGAHFCGFNTGTIGFCMLGDFTDVAPQPEAVDTLIKLLNWKVCENGIDPLAEVYHASSSMVLPTIIGHRDGCSTECPGNLLYAQLPDIRAALAENLSTGVQESNSLLGLQIFPNPASRQFNILLPEAMAQAVNFTLYDFTGQTIMGPIYVNDLFLTFNLPPDLAHGQYFLTFRNGNKLLGTRKLIVD